MVGRKLSHAKLLIALSVACLPALSGCATPFSGGFTLSADAGPEPAVREYDLYLAYVDQEIFPGAKVRLWGFTLDPEGAGQVPGPLLYAKEGELVRVRFHNNIQLNHTIHWHGVNVPWEMDGVPYLTQDPVEGGEVFTYEWIATPSGTMWYHCHVDAQRHIEAGLYGPLIIEPADTSEEPVVDRDDVIMFSSMDRKSLEWANGPNPLLLEDRTSRNGDALDSAQTPASWARQSVADRQVGAERRDWYPVTYPRYEPDYDTFLLNGYSYPNTPVFHIAEGETIRIRLIQAGGEPTAMHLHGHRMLVTHKDGARLTAPYSADVVVLFPGERYDVLIKGENPGMWDFHDHIGAHTANDHVFPGGQTTMLVYEGWRGAPHHGNAGEYAQFALQLRAKAAAERGGYAHASSGAGGHAGGLLGGLLKHG